MATTTIDLTHPVHVVHGDRTYGLGFRAECGCGSAGSWKPDRATAETDAVDHAEVAVGPGDGLDAVMSELLDIQDDLAAVVVWLAENWSADLPVPTVYCSGGGRGRQPGARVEVWTCCHDAGDLVRIGHLMGVPPVDDEVPDNRGVRYRNVVRDFGQVTVRAFTRLDQDNEAGS